MAELVGGGAGDGGRTNLDGAGVEVDGVPGKSEVSRICADLDAEVSAFADRSLAE